jgi:hypothetical protein
MTLQGIHHVNKHVVYRWKFATVSECHRKKDIVDIAEKSICAIDRPINVMQYFAALLHE